MGPSIQIAKHNYIKIGENFFAPITFCFLCNMKTWTQTLSYPKLQFLHFKCIQSKYCTNVRHTLQPEIGDLTVIVLKVPFLMGIKSCRCVFFMKS